MTYRVTDHPFRTTKQELKQLVRAILKSKEKINTSVFAPN